MAEDENVDVLSMDTELAERLGVVVPPAWKGETPRVPGRRSHSTSPGPYPASAKAKARTLAALRGKCAGGGAPRVLADLKPFLHMLPPEVARAEIKDQQTLYKTILDAGMKAYQHLLHYVVVYGSESSLTSVTSVSSAASASATAAGTGASNAPSSPTALAFPPYTTARLASLESELESISMMERIDQAYETLIEVGDAPPTSIAGSPDATPQVAANTLGLFAGAALRRPPTRAVESLMAAAQESAAAHSDMDRQDQLFDATGDADEYGACEDGLISLACSAGFTELTRTLLKIRGDTTFSGETDCTPLMEACAAGAEAVVKCLLDMDADVNILSSTKNTALIYASAAGHEECVRMLLATGKCNIEERNESGHCALMEAASGGHLNIVKMMINAGAKPMFINMNTDFKESPLTLASYKGHVEVVEYLLELTAVSISDEEMHTALMETSMDGHIEVAKVLLDAGAPVNMDSESFESPLTLACCGGHDELAKMLLDAGANIEEPNDESYTPLMEAAREGHATVVQALLERGAQVNAQTEETGETAMTVAACGGYTEVLEVLVQHGGDLELGANTPLMEAAQEGHVATVMYILGASRVENRCPNLQAHSNTALALAAENGHLDVLEVLYTSGADFNLECEGRTPLMKAAKNGYTDIVMYLLNKQANVNHRSSTSDATALSLACASGHKEIVRLLLKAGADPNIVLKDGVTCVLEAARNGYVEIVELMLDHNGVFPQPARPTAANAGPKTPPPSTATTNGTGKPVLAPCRRKKPCPGTATALPNPAKNPTTACHVPPDPCAYNASMLPPAGAAAGSVGYDIFPPVEAYSNPELARAYYAWLANSYNLQQGTNTAMHVPVQLPAGMSAADVLLSVEDIQKMLLTMVPANAGFYQHHMFTAQATVPYNEVTAKELAQLQQSANLLKNTDPSAHHPKSAEVVRVLAKAAAFARESNIPLDTLFETAFSQINYDMDPRTLTEAQAKTLNEMGFNFPAHPAASSTASEQTSTTQSQPVPTTSGSYLSNTYENIKKNFAGLPLPAVPVAAPKQKDSTAPVPTTAPSAQPPKTTQVSATQTKPTANTTKTQAAAAGISDAKWEAVVQELTAPMSPEERRVTRKKLQEMFGANCNAPPDVASLKSFLELFQEWTRMNHATDVNAVLEQQTASITETLKVLRPTVRSLPGGMVASASPPPPAIVPPIPASAPAHSTSATTIPAAATAVSSTPAAAAHRRTHSEGDDIDTPRAPAAQRAAFNVDKATESNNDTPLTLACSNGHKEMVSVLVSRGANIEHRDKKGFTPLILAATGGHMGVVEALINANANIEAQSERTKDTALSLACSGGRKEVVELLLNKGANKEHRNVSDYTPLSLAASGGYVEIVNMLLNNGAEINSRTGSKLGISPLMLAAMNGHKDATRVLLEKGSDINAQIETNRNTALTLACFQGRTDVVRLLLQYHANVEHRAKTGLTPLMEAANGGYVEVGELLLEHYADPNTTPVPSSRDTALTIAADKGHEKFVEMLVHRGAAIDSRNKKGCTALWLACHGGHLETVQTLVKHHADVDAQDNRKVSPLMVAFRKGHTKVVKCMVNHVKQFPNDQEMARYMSTIGPSTDTPSKEMQDLFVNCNECMTIIVKAKNAQAEQADKAAESLLALLAEEEEQARSKKQKKQKKKEEKKAKKAKKTDVNEPESTPPPPSPAPKKAPAVTKPSSPAPVPVVAPPTNGKEESEDCSDDESESLSVSVAKVAEPPKVQDDRVPMTAATVPEDVLVVPEKITGLSSRQKRQNNRRSRNDSGKLAPTEVTTSSHSGGSLTVQASPKSVISGVIVPKASPQSDEWVNASKRKQSSKSRAGAPTITVGLTAAQKEYFLDENGAFTGWKDVELARRRSNTLSVSSNVIARVIGRGGANINAIREATGASIEVEKQNARKDQHDRQICIRGTGEIVKNATLMINGLIADNETTVNDIIRQVLRGNTSVASSSSESGSRLGSVCQETAKTTAPVGGSGATKAPAPVTPAPPPSTGNVWQQRMAARQQQMQKTVPKEECSPPPSAATIVVPAPSSPIPSAVTVQAPLELAQPTTVAVAPAAPVREPSPPAEVPVSSPTLISTIAAESELNKAPGYRPQAQAAVSKVAAAPSPPPPAVESREVQPPKSISPVQNHNIFAAPIDVPAPMSRANDGSDSMLAPNQEGNNLSFLDQTTHAKLAQIWGSGGDDSGAHEPAWSSQILLNNFGNMNLSGNSAAEWSTSTDPLFMGGLPQAPSSPPRQPTSSAMGGPTSFNGPTHDWMSSPTNKGSTPLYGRTAQSQQHRRNLMMSPHQPAPVTVSSHQQQRQMTSSGAPPPESNLLFNQLAAQLLTHQGSGTAPPHSGGQSGQSFYPPSSASYSDPSMGGPMSSQQSAVHKSYAASYQSAAQEYENLHNLLSSYNHSHHSQGNGEFNGTSGGFPQSSSAPRTILGARAPGASYAPPPPPGFGGVAPPSLGANTNMPPPPPTMSMRSFFNNQMPPPAPSAFNAYSPLNNGTWSQAKSNPGSQPPHSQQQMPWSGGWN